MAFAEACTALPSYAKAESHYTGVGRAALALFSHNYVTAGTSINRFMMPLRCWVNAMRWGHRGCRRQGGILSLLKCIIILVMKWILIHTICHLLRYYLLGLSASQDSFLETWNVGARLLVVQAFENQMWKISQSFFFPKKVFFFLPEISESFSN